MPACPFFSYYDNMAGFVSNFIILFYHNMHVRAFAGVFIYVEIAKGQYGVENSLDRVL